MTNMIVISSVCRQGKNAKLTSHETKNCIYIKKLSNINRHTSLRRRRSSRRHCNAMSFSRGFIDDNNSTVGRAMKTSVQNIMRCTTRKILSDVCIDINMLVVNIVLVPFDITVINNDNNIEFFLYTYTGNDESKTAMNKAKS